MTSLKKPSTLPLTVSTSSYPSMPTIYDQGPSVSGKKPVKKSFSALDKIKNVFSRARKSPESDVPPVVPMIVTPTEEPAKKFVHDRTSMSQSAENVFTSRGDGGDFKPRAALAPPNTPTQKATSSECLLLSRELRMTAVLRSTEFLVNPEVKRDVRTDPASERRAGGDGIREAKAEGTPDEKEAFPDAMQEPAVAAPPTGDDCPTLRTEVDLNAVPRIEVALDHQAAHHRHVLKVKGRRPPTIYQQQQAAWGPFGSTTPPEVKIPSVSLSSLALPGVENSNVSEDRTKAKPTEEDKPEKKVGLSSKPSVLQHLKRNKVFGTRIDEIRRKTIANFQVTGNGTAEEGTKGVCGEPSSTGVPPQWSARNASFKIKRGETRVKPDAVSAPDRKPEFPKPDHKPEFPKPDHKPEFPRPDHKPEFPKLDLKPEFPKPDLKPEFPKPDHKPEFPKPDLKPTNHQTARDQKVPEASIPPWKSRLAQNVQKMEGAIPSFTDTPSTTISSSHVAKRENAEREIPFVPRPQSRYVVQASTALSNLKSERADEPKEAKAEVLHSRRPEKLPPLKRPTEDKNVSNGHLEKNGDQPAYRKFLKLVERSPPNSDNAVGVKPVAGKTSGKNDSPPSSLKPEEEQNADNFEDALQKFKSFKGKADESGSGDTKVAQANNHSTQGFNAIEQKTQVEEKGLQSSIFVPLKKVENKCAKNKQIPLDIALAAVKPVPGKTPGKNDSPPSSSKPEEEQNVDNFEDALQKFKSFKGKADESGSGDTKVAQANNHSPPGFNAIEQKTQVEEKGLQSSIFAPLKKVENKCAMNKQIPLDNAVAAVKPVPGKTSGKLEEEQNVDNFEDALQKFRSFKGRADESGPGEAKVAQASSHLMLRFNSVEQKTQGEEKGLQSPTFAPLKKVENKGTKNKQIPPEPFRPSSEPAKSVAPQEIGNVQLKSIPSKPKFGTKENPQPPAEEAQNPFRVSSLRRVQQENVQPSCPPKENATSSAKDSTGTGSASTSPKHDSIDRSALMRVASGANKKAVPSKLKFKADDWMTKQRENPESV